MRRYLKIWLQLAKNSFATFLSNKIDSLSYLAGKLFRFAFFWLMIISIFRFTDNLAGYTQNQLLLFLLTFNFIDVSTSLLFRGVYEFNLDVQRGNFDFALSKPANSLFMVLSKIVDFLDLIFLIPIVYLLFYVIAKLPEYLTVFNILTYIVFLTLGFLIALSMHIISAAITVLTIESQSSIWLYRDLLTFGRFPTDIYSPKIKFLLTYIMPVTVMVSFPVQAFLGVLTPAMMLAAFTVTGIFFFGSILLWKSSLRKYSSASS
jgi:ABC-2 type transport system permease protein